MRPKLRLTKCVVTYANMTSPEANRSRRITPSTCARVSSRNLVPCCDRTRRLLAEGVSAQTHKNTHIAQRLRKIGSDLSTNHYTNTLRISTQLRTVSQTCLRPL